MTSFEKKIPRSGCLLRGLLWGSCYSVIALRDDIVCCYSSVDCNDRYAITQPSMSISSSAFISSLKSSPRLKGGGFLSLATARIDRFTNH